MKVKMKWSFTMLLILAIFTNSCSSNGNSSPPTQPGNLKYSPTPTRSVPSGSNIVVKAKTDTNGLASVVDPTNDKTKNIEVNAAETGIGIPNIELYYINNGTNSIILVHDPSGKYLSTIVSSETQSNLSTGGHFSSFISFMLGDLGSAYLVVPKYQVVETIVIVLELASAIETVGDFIDFFRDMPDLEEYNFSYEESCWNGKQLADIASIGLMLLPGFNDIGESYLTADEALLDMLELSSMGFDLDIQKRLEELNGVIRFRSYHGIPVMKQVGWCLEPLDKSNANSVVDWVNYSLTNNEAFPFERLTGEFESVVYVNYIEGGQGKTIKEFINEISLGLPAAPHCDGYRDDGDFLQIWTSGWNPQITMTEYCYIDGCDLIDYRSSIVSFGFFKTDDAFSLGKIWLNQPSEFSAFDGANLVGCDHISPPSIQITSVPTQIPISCPGALPSRLVVGGYAYTIPDPPVQNRVRSGPGLDYPVVGLANPGAEMQVLEGPKCSNNWAWWNVIVLENNVIGWTSEGDTEYWLAPCRTTGSCLP
jgi:hypothetical protein